MHFEVRISPQSIDGNEWRAVTRREPLFRAAIASNFPRGANQVSKLLV